jgi:hypothetical protein
LARVVVVVVVVVELVDEGSLRELLEELGADEVEPQLITRFIVTKKIKLVRVLKIVIKLFSNGTINYILYYRCTQVSNKYKSNRQG